MIVAVQNVNQQFRSSEAYQKLPDTEEDLRKARKSDDSADDPFKNEDSDEDGGDNAISYSFGSGGYQEAVAGGTMDGAIFQVGA